MITTGRHCGSAGWIKIVWNNTHHSEICRCYCCCCLLQGSGLVASEIVPASSVDFLDLVEVVEFAAAAGEWCYSAPALHNPMKKNMCNLKNVTKCKKSRKKTKWKARLILDQHAKWNIYILKWFSRKFTRYLVYLVSSDIFWGTLGFCFKCLLAWWIWKELH